MIVIADTTPLRHLVAIGEADLLHKLYDVVTVPTGVWHELQAESTPDSVKQWFSDAPVWLKVVTPRRAVGEYAEMSALDSGEREAICLAIELEADLLLMDDRDGRAFAMSLRLPVTGTLGVLERADVLGLLPDFQQTLRDLEASGFYLSARLRDAVLQRNRDRHGKAGS